jgi:hypothetical protein
MERSELESYLIEITRDIFTVKDKETGADLVDLILDTAGQKGTGKWMSQHALDLGVPTTLITEAVFARCLSAQKDARVRAEAVLTGPDTKFTGDKKQFIEDVKQGSCTHRNCAAMLRAMSSLTQPPKSSAGSCRTGQSLTCGAVVASFVRCSSKTSRKRSTRIRTWKTCCWMTSSRPSTRLSHHGVESSRWQFSLASGPGFSFRSDLLRRLPPRPFAGEPVAGSARLLRCSHLRTHRQATRRKIPHRLDSRA